MNPEEFDRYISAQIKLSETARIARVAEHYLDSFAAQAGFFSDERPENLLESGVNKLAGKKIFEKGELPPLEINRRFGVLYILLLYIAEFLNDLSRYPASKEIDESVVKSTAEEIEFAFTPSADILRGAAQRSQKYGLRDEAALKKDAELIQSLWFLYKESPQTLIQALINGATHREPQPMPQPSTI